jgi:hypothetical protein
LPASRATQAPIRVAHMPTRSAVPAMCFIA